MKSQLLSQLNKLSREENPQTEHNNPKQMLSPGKQNKQRDQSNKLQLYFIYKEQDKAYHGKP